MSRSTARTTAHDAAPRVRASHRLAARLTGRLARTTADREAGMTTAEYAVGTVAACGFGGILYKVITSPEVLGLISNVISKALGLGL